MMSSNTPTAGNPADKMYTPSAYRPPSYVEEASGGRQRVLVRLSEIEQFLESEVTSVEDSDSETTGAESENSSSLTHSVAARRILLHPNQQVDVQQALLLNRVYAAESHLLTEVQKFFITSMLEDNTEFGEDSTNESQSAGQSNTDQPLSSTAMYTEEEDAQTYRGVSAKLMHNVDIFTATHRSTTTSILLHRLGRPLAPEHYLILEDFFNACQMPNNVEIFMLSRALRLPVNTISNFFYLKRTQLHRHYGSRWVEVQKAGAFRASVEEKGDALQMLSDDV